MAAVPITQTGHQGQSLLNATLSAATEVNYSFLPPTNVASYSPLTPVLIVNHGSNPAYVNAAASTVGGTVGQILSPNSSVNSVIQLSGQDQIFVYSTLGTTISIIQA